MTCSGFNVVLVRSVWQDDDEEEEEEENVKIIFMTKTRRRRRIGGGGEEQQEQVMKPNCIGCLFICSKHVNFCSGRDAVMFCTLAFARHASGECIIQPGIYDEIHKQMHKPRNQNDDY